MTSSADETRPASPGRRLEDAVLVTLLGGTLVLAGVQILLRNAFDVGFVWSDELLRILVLWIALGAAVAAARDDRHISIDVFSRFVRGRALAVVRTVIACFTALVCGVLAWHSGRFVYDAYRFEDTLLGDLPAWWFQVVLPLAFALMTWRYLRHAGARMREALGA